MLRRQSGIPKTISLGNETVTWAKLIVDSNIIHEIGKCRQKWKEHVQLMGTDCPEQRWSIDAEDEEGFEDCGEVGMTNTFFATERGIKYTKFVGEKNKTLL